MAGRGCKTYLTVVGGSPRRKRVKGFVPVPAYVMEPRGFPRFSAKPSTAAFRTKSPPIRKSCLPTIHVSVSPNVIRFWSKGRKVLRPPFVKVANVLLKLIAV